jgi:hypothetical protein
MIVLCGILTVGLFIAVVSAYQWRQEALKAGRKVETVTEVTGIQLERTTWSRDEVAGKLDVAEQAIRTLEGKLARATSEIKERQSGIDFRDEVLTELRAGRTRWNRALHKLLADMAGTFDKEAGSSSHDKIIRGLDARDAKKWEGNRLP